MTRSQEIRKEILMQLFGCRPLAMSPALLARQAKKSGLDYSEREVVAECDFLCGQGMAADVSDPVSGQAKFKITSKGVIEYESNQ